MMTTKQPTSSTALLGTSTEKHSSAGSVLPSTTTTTTTTKGAKNDDDTEAAETSSTNMTAFEYIETENSLGEASNVELFSDLTVVVAIHVLSDLLTEGAVEEEGNSAWLWFILRVYFLYGFWLQYMEVANLHNLLYYCNTEHVGSGSSGVVYYCIIFCYMAILVAITNACQNDHNQHAAILYLFGRVLGLSSVRLQALLLARRSTNPATTIQRNFYLRYTLTLPAYFLLDVSPFVFALIFHWDNEIAILWGGLSMIALKLAIRFFIGLWCDISRNYNNWDGKLANTDHTKERYKLVTLIFLGELCFSSTASPWDYYTSQCALLTGFGCFLCYFNARVKGRTEAWDRSALCNLLCHTTHFIIFCAVPVMGVGYVELMNGENEGNKHLSIAAGIFLIMLGSLELYSKDPEIPGQKVQIRRGARVLLYFAIGILLCTLFLVSSAASTYVPLFIFVTAIVLIWGTRIRAIAQ